MTYLVRYKNDSKTLLSPTRPTYGVTENGHMLFERKFCGWRVFQSLKLEEEKTKIIYPDPVRVEFFLYEY